MFEKKKAKLSEHLELSKKALLCQGNDCHLAVVTSLLQAITLDKAAFEELQPGEFPARAVSEYTFYFLVWRFVQHLASLCRRGL